VPFTFQTIDKNGLLLNMAQTWHQLRPGEIRHDCGGCHAHSQKPTEFRDTVAARKDYEPFDLTSRAPLVTSAERDESKKQESKRRWDAEDATGLRYHEGALSVEYHRDIKPILARSCTACHTKSEGAPAGNLVLDDDDTPISVENRGKFPGTYYRLAMDEKAQFGHKPIGYKSWGYPNASRYIRMLQARRSLLVWKIFGSRLDGFSNDDHPSESKPGSGDLVHQGKPADVDKNRAKLDIDFTGSVMPPPAAVASGKVKPLTDEDRRTILRWIDLGCPIDLDYDADHPETAGRGWSLDDSRPTLTLAWPQPGRNEPADRIRFGAADYGTGLDPASFQVTGDFEIAGAKPGTNVAEKFREVTPGVWELPLDKSSAKLPSGRLTVAVKDRQGNETRIVRTFNVE